VELVRHGHACFSLLDTRGRTWLFDPYRPGGLAGRMKLALPDVDPFAVISTHAHEDHAWRDGAWAAVPFVEEPCSWPGADIEVISSPHDAQGGALMGYTRCIRLTLEAADGSDFGIVHVGDVGTVDPDVVDLCRGADLMLVPAGGRFTIGPEQAEELVRRAAARCAVLMHLREPGVDLDLLEPEQAFARISAPVKRFLSGRLRVPEDMPEAGSSFAWLRACSPPMMG
jgi:L-ascorbate metabolism protein UlaG (beta-lactamase superfamily)